MTRPVLFSLALAMTWSGAVPARRSLQVLGPNYPRAFFFRATESVGPRTQRGHYSYERWNATFDRLGGIMGKALEEEVPGRSANLPFFTRFKHDHPRQVVLLHYNGHSRDPRDAGPGFFAGHWVYRVGCKLLNDLPAETGESELVVEDVSRFPTNMGRYRDKNVDLAVCALDARGKPDWLHAEQLELVSVDRKRNTLRVRRGAFGTTPSAFRAGRAYVAPHATEGPWGKRSHLLWYYNYSTHCPRDAKGRSCLEVLADDVARRFLPGGELAAFDGLEFDVMQHVLPGPRSGDRGFDLDGDGQADGGWFGGVNTYGLGVIEFCRRLREKLGDRRLLLADGGNPTSQRAMKWLNGIESEGWPHLNDWEISDWSGGMNRHRYWQRFARRPTMNYVNHKYTMPGPTPGSRRRPHVPWSHHRVALAVCQFFDAAVCYSFAPPREPDEEFGIWDELQAGTARQPGWLGRPLGKAVRPAETGRDLLAGAGVRLTPAFQRRLVGDHVRFTCDGDAIRADSSHPDSRNLRFRLVDLPTQGPDLTVFLRMRAAPLRGYPPWVPRLAWVGIPPEQGLLVQPELPEVTGTCLRGGREQPLDPRTGATVRYQAKWTLAGESHVAYYCHPPWRHGKVGYTFWEREVLVPTEGVLEFYTGLTPKAEQRSDGVTYRVVLNRRGQPDATVFAQHIEEWRWQRHSVSLKRWAGKRVALKFITDCGPHDDSTTDQARWGEVRLVSTNPDFRAPEPIRHMTFVGRESFESTFYFRGVESPTLTLAVQVEETGPVWVESVRVYAAPEAVARVFEHGLVLCNPASHPFTFDLRRLAPARRFRRLAGQPHQDPQINNGRPVGDTVTLDPMDALFLQRQQ